MTSTRHTDDRSPRLQQRRQQRHRRADVLRQASARVEQDVRRSPQQRDLLATATGTAGVAATFADDTDLVGALLLRWHARLSAALERALAAQPRDLPGAVAQAWADTARDLPGLRALLDDQRAAPSSPAMAALLERARRKEHARLAWAAGLAAGDGERAVAAGARLEAAARDRLARLPEPASAPAQRPGSPRLAQRLRALIPA